MKKLHKGKIFKYMCLFLYIACTVVLIVEASMNGDASSSQSNAVGGTIADIFNDLSGDQTEQVIPTAVEIVNPIYEAKVNSTYQLETSISPANSTYQSIRYVTSNMDIATISSDGIISFHNPGEVTITARNEEFLDILDTITILVKEVEAEKITTSINQVLEDGCYTLYMGKQYVLNTVFTPASTTNQELEYEINKPSFLTISSNGVITPEKYSGNEIVEIKVKHDSLENIIKVKIDYSNTIALNSIYIDTSSIYVSQSLTPNVTFEPYNATFKDYVLTSSNSNILKVSGKKIIGVGEGEVKLTVTSTQNPKISNTISVTVLKQPEINYDKSTVSLSNVLYVGNSTNVRIVKYPNYALNPEVSYLSSNTNVCTVDQNGKVIACGVGTCNIIVKVNQKDYVFTINVQNPIDVITDDFDISQSDINLECNKDIDLSKIITISKWYPSKPTNTKLSFELADKSMGQINGNNINMKKAGHTTLVVTHVESGITKEVRLSSHYDYDINYTTTFKEMLSVGNSIEFAINDNQTFKHQKYNFYYDHELISITMLDDKYTVEALSEGDIVITVVPCVDNEEYLEFKKEVNFKIKNIYTSILKCHILSNDSYVATNEIYHLKLNNNYYVKTSLSLDTTNYLLHYYTTDPSIAQIMPDGEMVLKKNGEVTLTVLEELSGLKETFNVKVENFVKLKEENYIVKGNTLIYQEEEKCFYVENGNSLTFKLNFDEESTYKKVTYTSSNDKIAKVGQDGKITPLRVGNTVITAVCSDQFSEEVIVEIDLTVKPQNLINNLSDFFYKVRKGIGHFGAFLVLGIFSTFTWILFISRKKLPFSIMISTVLGFVIAASTEIIQYFVPGRYGTLSDVLLDFSGFMISTLIISLYYIAHEMVTYIKSTKNNNPVV